MKLYNYFTYGEPDEYGQQQLSKDIKGQIKIAINISSQATQDNILYKNCGYVGLTKAPVNDSYVIQYGTELLKVLYVNSKGRYTQVFLQNVAN